MFKSLRRFAVKNKAWAITLSCVFLCFTYTVLLWFLDASRFAIITVNVMLVFVSFMYVEGCPGKIMNDATKKFLENCDPYPLLEETEFILSANPKDRTLLVTKINRAVALRGTGDYRSARDLLQTMEVEAYTLLMPCIHRRLATASAWRSPKGVRLSGL